MLAHLLNPSSLWGGGVGDLAVWEGVWGEKSPEKKVLECVWGYFGGVLTMFPDGFNALWAL